MDTFLTSINKDDLTEYLTLQLNTYFPDKQIVKSKYLKPAVKESLNRLYLCFNKVHLPYYRKNGIPSFNHLHGDHYSMFLYLVSNTLYVMDNSNENTCAKIFLLNKALHGIDAFYSIKLPEHFLFVHPIGTILGRANYGDYFITYQGVTVGATTDGIYPTFQSKTILYAGSTVIGNCTLGENTIMAANSSLINISISANKTITGNFPSNRIIENKKSLINNYFII